MEIFLIIGGLVGASFLAVALSKAFDPDLTVSEQDANSRPEPVGQLNRSSLDAPHRAFTVAAALWAVVTPFVMETERCSPGSIRGWVVRNLTGDCSGSATDAASIILGCSLPPLLAYLAIFVAVPPVLRWIAAGNDQAGKP